MKGRWLKLMMATAALAALPFSGCSLSTRHPYYYNMIVESHPLVTFDLYAWIDDNGDWMTGAKITTSMTVSSDEIMVMQQFRPCPLGDMAKLIRKSGKYPDAFLLFIIPYPIESLEDFQTMVRRSLYENWFVYLGTELGLLNNHSIDYESMEDYLGHRYK